VGTPLELAALNVNCADPAGGDVVVTVSPGNKTVVLKDDGVAPDHAAGDGIYRGAFTPETAGVYTFTLANGESLTVLVSVQYVPHPAPYVYRTIAGTNLNLCDDCVTGVAPGFPIQFAGTTFAEVGVHSNGMLSFGTPNWSSPSNYPLPPGTTSTGP
jgi:hypothetical protein